MLLEKLGKELQRLKGKFDPFADESYDESDDEFDYQSNPFEIDLSIEYDEIFVDRVCKLPHGNTYAPLYKKCIGKLAMPNVINTDEHLYKCGIENLYEIIS